MPYQREGTKNWWIVVAGVRKSSGTQNLEDAKALEVQLNHKEWLYTHMGLERSRTWREAVVKYLNERKHKPSYDTMVLRLTWWDPHLGKVEDIRKINRDMIDNILHKYREITPLPSPTNTTANKYAAMVGAVLNAACREWRWLVSTPKFRRYPEPEHKREFLTVEQWKALEAELPEHLRLPATFALATGIRADKVFGLCWNQIDMRSKTLSYAGNTIKRGNVIPLNRTAMSVLESIQAGSLRHLQRVFCYEGVPLNFYGKAWYKALNRVGLGKWAQWKDGDGKPHAKWEGFTWHGLRHTFSSWLGQSGVNEMVIDQLGGWAEKDTRSIYTHLHTASLRPHCEVIDTQLATQQGNLLVATLAAS